MSDKVVIKNENGVVLSIDPSNTWENLRLESNGVKWADNWRCRINELLLSLDDFCYECTVNQNGDGLILRLHREGLEIIHEFRISSETPVLEEKVQIRNLQKSPHYLEKFHCGLVMHLQQEDGLTAEGVMDYVLTPVPFRQDMRNPRGKYDEIPLIDVLQKRGGYRVDWRGCIPKVATDEFGADGWICWSRKNPNGMMVLKHSPDAVEFSLAEPCRYYKSVENPSPQDLRQGVLYGGGGIWHEDPEEAALLQAGESFTFGTTLYHFFNGDWQQGYSLFRKHMNGFGHGVSDKYDPPVHWNELYDNRLWWLSDNDWGSDYPNRQKYYRLDDMLEEAEKAKDLGCEALYLDPGWDTAMGSAVWADDRLTEISEFAERIRKEYQLSLSLHNTFATWTDPTSFPEDLRVVGKDGKRLFKVCGASDQYWKMKADRMKKLAAGGARFFMVDGTWFTGECYDPNHGHSIPARRSEHGKAIRNLIEEIRKEYPDVLIELHDPVLSGDLRYTPCHYIQGPAGHQELWACEFMWEPLDDVLTGRAMSLYYYNLAYDLPLYIHIDLRKDNLNALAFWWYASTCRHFGVGGKCPSEEVWHIHQENLRRVYRPFLEPTFTNKEYDDPLPSPELWRKHKEAMPLYMKLKSYFVRGEFYGLDELEHVHTIPGKGAVMVIFNVENKPAKRKIVFTPSQIGLADGKLKLTSSDGVLTLENDRYEISCDLPPQSPKILHLTVMN